LAILRRWRKRGSELLAQEKRQQGRYNLLDYYWRGQCIRLIRKRSTTNCVARCADNAIADVSASKPPDRSAVLIWRAMDNHHHLRRSRHRELA
jgi:hypothetical protein